MKNLLNQKVIEAAQREKKKQEKIEQSLWERSYQSRALRNGTPENLEQLSRHAYMTLRKPNNSMR